MLEAALLTALLLPTQAGDPPRTQVPDAAAANDGEHPVTAAVRQSLEAHGGKTSKPFTMIVSLQTSSPQKLVEAFRTPLVETRKEEGNIMYLLNRDADEREKFVLVERWKSLDALDEHLAQPYLVQLLTDLDAIATVEIRVLRPVPAKGGKKKAKKAE